MKPIMTDREITLFTNFLSCSHDYVEFGAGGSTCLAAEIVRDSIMSIDSSKDWLTRVKTHCRDNGYKLTPETVYVDIGQIGEWGYPTDPKSQSRWPTYHRGIWDRPKASQADLYMVDGRFRVACFMQILLHCNNDACIAIHDFSSRPHYNIIHEVAREIAKVDDLSIFYPIPHLKNRARSILSQFEVEPA